MLYVPVSAVDGQTIASGSVDKTIQVVEARRGTDHYTLRGHTDAVFEVSASADGQMIASGSR
jgi:WD40 repeat protein